MLHNFQFAMKMIRKRPLRMSLTLLQIAMGVASVTLVLCFVFSILYHDRSNTDRLMRVQYGKEEQTEDGYSSYMGEPAFSPGVVEKVRQRATYLDGLSIVGQEYGSFIDYGGIQYRSGIIYGVDADFASMVHLKLTEGSFFSPADVQSRTPVVVISEELSRQLFGAESGVGKTFVKSMANGLSQELKVIGVYQGEEQMRFSGLVEVHFLIPYTSLSMYAMGGEGAPEVTFDWILAEYKPGKRAEAVEELNQLMEYEMRASGWQPHQQGLGLIAKDSNEDAKELRNQLARTFGLFLGSFAFVALVISSIGILSMMLVSIVERTREIGLRRALGASRMSILGQILSESVFLALAGGVLGLVLAAVGVGPIMNGIFMKGYFSRIIDISVHLSWRAVLVAFGSVVLVGLVAGVYPGMQAARLSPVEAVREG